MRNFSVKFYGVAADIPALGSAGLNAELLAEYGLNSHNTNINVYSRQSGPWCRIIGIATSGQTLSEDFTNSTATNVQARVVALVS